MPTKKTAKKKTATRKTVSKKKTAVAKMPARKVPAKKPASKTSARKTAAKKPASTGKATKKATGKPSSKPKASDLIRKSSHTPAIFKGQAKRTINVLFTLDDVRELLKRRAEEDAKEALEKAKDAPQKKTTNNKVVDNNVDQGAVQKSKHHAASLDDILGLSSPGGGAAAGPDNVPRKWRKYHRLLIELRDHVRAELNLHSSDTLKRSQKEDAGDISISVDAGTDNFDRDFALSLLSSEQESLKEIEAAINRIYDGSYGRCEVTGETIKAERLEAVPFTRFSLEGQRQHESTSRKRVSRAGAFLNEVSGEAISFGNDDDN